MRFSAYEYHGSVRLSEKFKHCSSNADSQYFESYFAWLTGLSERFPSPSVPPVSCASVEVGTSFTVASIPAFGSAAVRDSILDGVSSSGVGSDNRRFSVAFCQRQTSHGTINHQTKENSTLQITNISVESLDSWTQDDSGKDRMKFLHVKNCVVYWFQAKQKSETGPRPLLGEWIL